MDIENLKNNLEVLFLNDHIDRYAFELLETIADNAQALQLLQSDVSSRFYCQDEHYDKTEQCQKQCITCFSKVNAC